MKRVQIKMNTTGRIIPTKILIGTEYFVNPTIIIRIKVNISIRNLISVLTKNNFIIFTDLVLFEAR
ncbi:hypothetical protein LCR01_18660 [Companilactobacillus crustorum]|uniref:Uncharacterized protein n=1 Tax=Companilactobacillus crustorum TaxID=392416 RepID=A0AB34AER9_9LACO|nr:hypothetical protein LCR01_18660 [Companilactobacillus crustorum]